MAELLLLKDISLIIIAASVIAVASSRLRQPLILGYVLAGILLGPVFHLVGDAEPIIIISELGIAFLLFIIGLELDFRRLRKVGLVSSAIGLVQVVVTAAAGYFIALLLGFNSTESVYIGLTVSFSSTMIVAKLLGEKKELDSLHGELVIVVLIVQDILAVLAFSVIGSGSLSLAALPGILLKGVLLVAGSFLVYRFILPVFLREAVHSPELIFISALTAMFVFSALARYLGYSFAIGAFIAGVALSTVRYSHEIIGRVKPLKDFFLVLFFVTLGMQMVLSGFGSVIVPLLVLLLVVLLLKPLIIIVIVRLFRYSSRTAFFTGAQLAQVGEFSLVIAAQGILLSHITQSMFSMLITLTIITMLLTAYIIRYDDALYSGFFSRLLAPFGKDSKETNLKLKEPMSGHMVILGYHRMAERIISGLREKGAKFVVVDHNPEKASSLSQAGIVCVCGDMTNPEVYEAVNLDKAQIVVSTVQNLAANTALIHIVKKMNKGAIVMVSSNDESDAVRLYESGADFVIIPLVLGGEKVVNYLTHLTPKGIVDWGQKYYRELKRGMH